MSHTSNVAQTRPAQAVGGPYRLRVAPGDAYAHLMRDARIRKNLTQDELADLAGLNRSTVIRWESGRASRPDPQQVRAACRVLGVDPLRAAVALGYLAADDVGPPEPDRRIDPRILEVIEMLEDPLLPPDEVERWVRYLRQEARGGDVRGCVGA